MLRGFLFIPVPVEGNSMENVLKQGDMVVMEKFSEIRRFDIVVFQLADGTIYIKRVIGLPGENVSYQNDQLKINGKVVKEPYLTKNMKVRSCKCILYDGLHTTRTDGTIQASGR